MAQVFVNFPDPWPKRRHPKHRIIRPEFLAELEGVMAPNGQAIFVTDDLPYAGEMIKQRSVGLAGALFLRPPTSRPSGPTMAILISAISGRKKGVRSITSVLR